MANAELKHRLYTHCVYYVEERMGRIREEMNQHQLAANEETKSSAGDKYETGRAMAQLEIERNAVQLMEAEKLMTLLNSIDPSGNTHVAVSGSLVTTSKGMYYIAISIGLVTIDQQSCYVVSSDSPIGKQLLGKRAGDELVWRNETYRIEKVD